MFYPAIAPFQSGLLPLGEGHEMYWEECGHPKGIPIVFLHGGPGAGCSEMSRRFFKPNKFRVILFDQRGCGRSRFKDPLQGLSLEHLVRDMEALRVHLGIERWALFGGSWGTTLGLAYAARHPERVEGLILRGVFTSTQAELAWLYQEGGAARVFPKEWEEFKSNTTRLHAMNGPSVDFKAWRSVLQAHLQILKGADATQRDASALTWAQWEQAVMSVSGLPRLGQNDVARSFSMAIISCHMFLNDPWLNDESRWQRFDALLDKPCHIVQGQFDVVTPMHTAYGLHQQLPKSQLTVAREAGHASGDAPLAQALIKTLDNW
jgi:proline iminopeptidase